MLSTADLGPALLFCPGDRPERFRKAVDGADQAILDLEDGAAPANRDMARDAIAAWLRANAAPVFVRINHPATDRGRADADAIIAAGARALILPKTESAAEIDAVGAQAGVLLFATIETARGVEAMADILAHPAVAGIGWGPYDLAADMGMRRVRDDRNRLLSPLATIRDRLLVHAAAARKIAFDTVTAEMKDTAIVLADAMEAADMGFVGKFAIHPLQTPIIRQAFRPSDAQIDRSRRMLAAATTLGAFAFDGEMIDEPMLARARRIVAAAEKSGAKA